MLRQMVGRPELADLAQLIAMADTDEVVRLRLLRAIRDVGVQLLLGAGRAGVLSAVARVLCHTQGSGPRPA
jgi:hypothetical protein